MPTVKTTIRDRVALVTLDDPPRRNAMSATMAADMAAVFDRLEACSDIGAVVITGAGPAFCAGADLSDLHGAQTEGLRAIYEGFLRIARSPLPTVAAVNGAAVGAGMNLALVCDLRIASTRARFDCRFLDLGLHPGGGHTWMLGRIVGPQVLAAMVLFGQALDGEEAVRRHLAWSVVDDADLLDEACQLASRAASGPPELVREVKATLRDMVDIHDHAEAVERELGPQAWSLQQPEFGRRLAALKKRIRQR